MVKKLISCLLSAILLVSCTDDTGVVDPVEVNVWQNFTTSNGLISNDIFKLYEDTEGNVWIGTDEGIMRYNGNQFENFPELNDLLVFVEAITQSQDGRIWAGSENGLGIYENGDWQFFDQLSEFPLGIFELMTDADGNVWMGTTILGIIVDTGNFNFVQFLDNQCFPCNDVFKFFQDSEGNVWIGTDGGLKKFDGSNFQLFREGDGLSNDRIRSIEEDQWGRIWIGSLFGENATLYEDQGFVQLSLQNGIEFNAIASLVEDRFGTMWLGLIGGGLVTYDGALMRGVSDAEGPGLSTITTLITRSNGEVWAASLDGGIWVFSGNR